MQPASPGVYPTWDRWGSLLLALSLSLSLPLSLSFSLSLSLTPPPQAMQLALSTVRDTHDESGLDALD